MTWYWWVVGPPPISTDETCVLTRTSQETSPPMTSARWRKNWLRGMKYQTLTGARIKYQFHLGFEPITFSLLLHMTSLFSLMTCTQLSTTRLAGPVDMARFYWRRTFSLKQWALMPSKSQSNGQKQAWMIICVLSEGKKTFRCFRTNSCPYDGDATLQSAPSLLSGLGWFNELISGHSADSSLPLFELFTLSLFVSWLMKWG